MTSSFLGKVLYEPLQWTPVVSCFSSKTIMAHWFFHRRGAEQTETAQRRKTISAHPRCSLHLSGEESKFGYGQGLGREPLQYTAVVSCFSSKRIMAHRFFDRRGAEQTETAQRRRQSLRTSAFSAPVR
jgi:hypothetical protein